MATRAKRTADAHERQAAIIQLRNQGLRYRDIAAQYGIKEQRAHQIWKAGIQRIGEPVIQHERSRALEVSDLALRKLWTKEQNPPPSRVIQHKDGTVETTFDLDYHTRVMGELRKWEEHRARLLGLYSVEVKAAAASPTHSYDEFLANLRAILLRQVEFSSAAEPAIETESTDITPEPVDPDLSPADAVRRMISSHAD